MTCIIKNNSNLYSILYILMLCVFRFNFWDVQPWLCVNFTLKLKFLVKNNYLFSIFDSAGLIN